VSCEHCHLAALLCAQNALQPAATMLRNTPLNRPLCIDQLIMASIHLVVWAQARGIGWDSGQHAEVSVTADGTQTEEGVWPEASSGGQPMTGAGPASLRPAPQQQTAVQQQGLEAESMLSAATGALLEPTHTTAVPAPADDVTLQRRMPDAEIAAGPHNVSSWEAGAVDSKSAASDTAVHAPSADTVDADTAPAGGALVEHTENRNNMAASVEPPEHAWQQQPGAASGRLQDRLFFMDADRGNEPVSALRMLAAAASAGGGGHGHDAASPAGQADELAGDERMNNSAG